MESQGQASGRCIFLLLIEVQAIASHALIRGPYRFLKSYNNQLVNFKFFHLWKGYSQKIAGIIG
jgi:hypothetical protein